MPVKIKLSDIEKKIEFFDKWVNVVSATKKLSFQEETAKGTIKEITKEIVPDLGSAIDTTNLRLSLIGVDRIVLSIPDNICQRTRQDTEKAYYALYDITEADYNTTTGLEIIDCVLDLRKQLNLCRIAIKKMDRKELDSVKTKTTADVCEHSKPLSWKQWAKVFNMSCPALRAIRDAENPLYHFRKTRKNARKWTLPIQELPAEYLEKYRKTIF